MQSGIEGEIGRTFRMVFAAMPFSGKIVPDEFRTDRALAAFGG